VNGSSISILRIAYISSESRAGAGFRFFLATRVQEWGILSICLLKESFLDKHSPQHVQVRAIIVSLVWVTCIFFTCRSISKFLVKRCGHRGHPNFRDDVFVLVPILEPLEDSGK